MSGEGYKYGTSNKPLKVPPSDPEYLKYQAMVRYKVMREWIIPQKYTEEGGAYADNMQRLLRKFDHLSVVQPSALANRVVAIQRAVRFGQ